MKHETKRAATDSYSTMEEEAWFMLLAASATVILFGLIALL
ncbi:MAG: hypothetical protein ACI9TH_001177 [Kiritimatiellia bacterium]|jgi:hypothetical protein